MVWLRGGNSPLFFLYLFSIIGFFNSMKKGYYQITEALKSAVEANDHINQVSWGNIFDIDFRKMDMYPLAHVITGNATLNERTISYEFDLLVMDVVDYRRGDQYDAYFRLTNDPIAEPFDEDYEANICGWKATLVIEAINPNNIC